MASDARVSSSTNSSKWPPKVPGTMSSLRTLVPFRNLQHCQYLDKLGIIAELHDVKRSIIPLI
jgi:hypothetical protein